MNKKLKLESKIEKFLRQCNEIFIFETSGKSKKRVFSIWSEDPKLSKINSRIVMDVFEQQIISPKIKTLEIVAVNIVNGKQEKIVRFVNQR